MHFKKAIIFFSSLAMIDATAQDTLPEKSIHWKLILNYSPSLFYQEPGLGFDYRLPSNLILEARYNYLFWGAHLFLFDYGGHYGPNYWIVHGNIFRLSLKGFNKNIQERKHFNEVRITYKDVTSSPFCWVDGSNGLNLVKREIRYENKRMVSIAAVFAKQILIKKNHRVTTFFNFGFSYGEKVTYQLKYGLTGSCDDYEYPPGTHFIKPIIRPSIDIGLNFAFDVLSF